LLEGSATDSMVWWVSAAVVNSLPVSLMYLCRFHVTDGS